MSWIFKILKYFCDNTLELKYLLQNVWFVYFKAFYKALHERVSYNASYFNLLLPIESNLQKILGKFIDLVNVLAGSCPSNKLKGFLWIISNGVIYIQNLQYIFYANIAKTSSEKYEILPFINHFCSRPGQQPIFCHACSKKEQGSWVNGICFQMGDIITNFASSFVFFIHIKGRGWWLIWMSIKEKKSEFTLI